MARMIGVPTRARTADAEGMSVRRRETASPAREPERGTEERVVLQGITTARCTAQERDRRQECHLAKCHDRAVAAAA
jgi:hypothetical protein